MINCSVVGATGYTGAELVRILLRHPYVRISALTTRQKEPLSIHQLIPSLPHDTGLEIKRHSFASLKKSSDVVFLCLPHTEAMETAEKFIRAGKIVIDLSADFRLRQYQDYEKWYGVKHRARSLLKKSVYGLPEFYRNEIQNSRLIANPGCYPTGAALALLPLFRAGIADVRDVVIDSKSGVSGAGKKLKPLTQFYELDENFQAYRVGAHQHTPEIEQELSEAAGRRVGISFVTHLLPVKRGILTTAYVRLTKKWSEERVRNIYEKSYTREPFVRLRGPGEFPAIKDVRETNYCDIGVYVDSSKGKMVVVSAIDNLLKGASGQAVQNMNIRLGFPEEEGLRTW